MENGFGDGGGLFVCAGAGATSNESAIGGWRLQGRERKQARNGWGAARDSDKMNQRTVLLQRSKMYSVWVCFLCACWVSHGFRRGEGERGEGEFDRCGCIAMEAGRGGIPVMPTAGKAESGSGSRLSCPARGSRLTAPRLNPTNSLLPDPGVPCDVI